MSKIVTKDELDYAKQNGHYDPRFSQFTWDKRVVCFLKHHYGLTVHQCTPLEALYKTHGFLKDMEHSVDVEQLRLRVFSKERPYWFSVDYWCAPKGTCEHCGGKRYEPTSWAVSCHKCSKGKETVTASCGSNRYTIVVVDSES